MNGWDSDQVPGVHRCVVGLLRMWRAVIGRARLWRGTLAARVWNQSLPVGLCIGLPWPQTAPRSRLMYEWCVAALHGGRYYP